MALRTLGSLVSVAGRTPLGEPIVVVDSDRLVLHRETGSFWVAARCRKCGRETACIDLGAHERECPGAVPRPTPARAKSASVRDRPPRHPIEKQKATSPNRAQAKFAPVHGRPHRRTIERPKPTAPNPARGKSAPVRERRRRRPVGKPKATKKSRRSSHRPVAGSGRRPGNVQSRPRSRMGTWPAKSPQLASIYVSAVLILGFLLLIAALVIFLLAWLDTVTGGLASGGVDYTRL